MNTLVTVDALKRYLGLEASVNDSRLLECLQTATAQFERLTGRGWLPRYRSIAHDVSPARADVLLLKADLLLLETLLNGDGSTIAAQDVELIPAESSASLLRLREGLYFVFDQSPLAAVTVSGLWCWHDRAAAAFLPSGDSVQDLSLNSSATSISVSDADATTPDGRSPRFEAGQLLGIGSELLWLLEVDNSANTLTVVRGANGSSPAAHAQATPISVFAPPADVHTLILRWAGWLYREPELPQIEALPEALRIESLLRQRLSLS